MWFISGTVIRIVCAPIAFVFNGKPCPNAVYDARWHYLMLHSWCRKMYWLCLILVWWVPMFIILYKNSNFFLLCEGAANVHVNTVYFCLVKGTDPVAFYYTLYFSSHLVYSNSLKDCEWNHWNHMSALWVLALMYILNAIIPLVLCNTRFKNQIFC